MKMRKLFALTFIFMLSVQILHGASATWNFSPSSGEWNTAPNWTPATVPNGAADTATFALSNTTGVALSGNTQVNGIVFNSGASAFTITASPTFVLTISGVGITNNSGTIQHFVSTVAIPIGGDGGQINFTNGATAGSLTVFTNNGAVLTGASGHTIFGATSTAGNGIFINNGGNSINSQPGSTNFNDNSTAGNGTFDNNGGVGAPGGFTSFLGNSTAGNGTFTNTAGQLNRGGGGHTIFGATATAGNGTFTNDGSDYPNAQSGYTNFSGNSTAGTGTFTNNGSTYPPPFAYGGETSFVDTATAGNGTFTNNGSTVSGAAGGETYFGNTATAGNGTFINNGGTVSGAAGGTTDFSGDSTGGTARVEVFGNGNLDISLHNAPGVTTGSVEGSGVVFLGARNLTVGSNNLSTTFSGVIQDGDLNGGTSGSLTKIGSGTLTLSGASTYAGGTLINAGTLQASQNGALGVGNVSVTASGATLRLQSGATNNYIADAATLRIVSGSIVDLNFTGTPDTVRSLIVDGVGQPDGLYGSAASGAPHQRPEFTGTGTILVTNATPTPTPTPSPTPTTSPTTTPNPSPSAAPATQTVNLSTRMRVQTGDLVGIGGFIITGSAPKRVILRAIGPSLTQFGVPDALADPVMELHGPADFTTITNDNWRDTQQAEIQATGIPPTNDLESAIVVTLNPGVYTAVVRGRNSTSGVALVEVYDLDQAAASKLANISTRAFVSTGSDTVIAGFILGGHTANDNVILRGIGPSLTQFGVPNALANPTLELRDSNGELIRANNDWQDDPAQATIISAAGLAPTNTLESGIAATLSPGPYTALLAGLNNGTGVGLVEVYDRGAP